MDDKKPIRSSIYPPSLTEEQKERLAKKIIAKADNAPDLDIPHKNRSVNMRLPEHLIREIEKIVKLTGLTKNSAFIEVIRKGVREKLKELEEQ
jgi:hypothetical protein